MSKRVLLPSQFSKLFYSSNSLANKSYITLFHFLFSLFISYPYFVCLPPLQFLSLTTDKFYDFEILDLYEDEFVFKISYVLFNNFISVNFTIENVICV